MAPLKLTEAALDSATAEFRPTLLAGLGAALYRAGRYHEAISRLEEAERHSSGCHLQVEAFLAMANQARGRRDEALRWLGRLRGHPPNPRTGSYEPWDELQVELLQREAEAVVLLDPVFPADPFAP
jgi:hypothetical protein